MTVSVLLLSTSEVVLGCLEEQVEFSYKKWWTAKEVVGMWGMDQFTLRQVSASLAYLFHEGEVNRRPRTSGVWAYQPGTGRTVR